MTDTITIGRTIGHSHQRIGTPNERRRLHALRETVGALWEMDLSEDRLNLTYRVDRNKLMVFGISMKMVADIGHLNGSLSLNKMKYMNRSELQREVEPILKTRNLAFTNYELDMKKFILMKKINPERADIFAACNSEMFPHCGRGITVEMYAMKYGLNEKDAENMLNEIETELLIQTE